MRDKWDKYALNLAETASSRSEDPFQKVGACALDFNYRVLSVGYNGLAAGKDVELSFWSDRDHRRKYMIHAETNCLSLCKKGEVDILATTLLPCSYCSTMIAAYGVKNVLYKEEYDFDTEAKKIFGFYSVNLLKYS